jgi:O-antigen ligase
MRMKPSLLAFSVALVVVTIGSRAIPMRDTIDHPAVFAALAILSLGSSVAIYRVYRAEARRIGDNSRKFPLMMGFISCVLLIQLSMRVSQL